jgi:hypothetical protein
MNKAAVLLLSVSLLLVPTLGICGSNGWTGNFNLFLGWKILDESNWAPVDQHEEIGFLLDFKPKSWPVSIAIDYLKSNDDKLGSFVLPFTGTPSEKVGSETSEIDLGIRKIWNTSPKFRPFVGGGIAFIKGEFDLTSGSTQMAEDDTGTGIWLDAGMYWIFGGHFNLGIDLRYSWAEVTLFNVNANAGGWHFGMIFGYHW